MEIDSTLVFGFAGLLSLFVFLVGYAIFIPKNKKGFALSNEKQLEENSSLKFFVGLTNDLMKALPASNAVTKEKGTKTDKRVEELLIKSGNPWGITVAEFKTLKIVGAVVGFTVGWILGFGIAMYAPIPPVVVALLATFYGFYTTEGKHKDIAKKRDLEFKRQLPEALDLISITLSGGNSFAKALEVSIPSMQEGVVRSEFEKVAKDISSGSTLEAALEKMAYRSPNDTVKTFVRSVQTATKTNAPLAEILDSRAKASREEFFSYIHQKVAQLESKIWMILSPTMLPALLIIVLAPSITVLMGAM